MWPRFATSSSLRCSFCHKPKDQVEPLLAGPRGVYICTTCVGCCQIDGAATGCTPVGAADDSSPARAEA